MRIGLFTDMDGVLTDTPVNMHYAKAIGADESLIEIERMYGLGHIDCDAFNQSYIGLFASHGFTRQVASQNFDDILKEFDITALELLGAIGADVHVVTSSPDFFVYQLASRLGISTDNMCCSHYEFDENDVLCSCKASCNAETKRSYVQQKIKEKDYDFVIGIGDTPSLDGSFLELCDLRLLIGESLDDGFLACANLAEALIPIRKLYECIGKSF